MWVAKKTLTGRVIPVVFKPSWSQFPLGHLDRFLLDRLATDFSVLLIPFPIRELTDNSQIDFKTENKDKERGKGGKIGIIIAGI